MAARCYKTLLDMGCIDNQLGRQALIANMAKDLRRMPDLAPAQLLEEIINDLSSRSKAGTLGTASVSALVRLQEAMMWLNNLFTGRRGGEV